MIGGSDLVFEFPPSKQAMDAHIERSTLRSSVVEIFLPLLLLQLSRAEEIELFPTC